MLTLQGEHKPVMLEEACGFLQLRSGAVIVDATVGGGGHAERILAAIGPTGQLLCIDRDEEALVRTAERLSGFHGRVEMIRGNFANLDTICHSTLFHRVDGIVFDLGFSSHLLEDVDRGFSFSLDGPLDMRMDRRQSVTARDLVNGLSERELAEVFHQYGEERRGRQVARAIVSARQHRTIETTADLRDVIMPVLGRGHAKNQAHGRKEKHPLTKVFQSLRIAVNDELSNLERVLPLAIGLLVPGGRLVVISYHSLEDRIVKQFMQRESEDCLCAGEFPVCQCGHHRSLSRITKRPLRPSEDEVRQNNRARSALMRVAERLPDRG